MRPYQITATERILNRINIAHNYKKYGDVAAGGYIWHTTGSGKTLTSFKTARLATQLPFIDKVVQSRKWWGMEHSRSEISIIAALSLTC